MINDDYTVLFWNQCLEDWTGISKPDIEGKKLGNHFPWLNAPRYRMRLETIFEGDPRQSFHPSSTSIFSLRPFQMAKCRYSTSLSAGYLQTRVKTATMRYGQWKMSQS
ncbi:MAG: hypothetical protein GY749_47110 [Desulfobacteraceae bacterium]|nr:hypothetical protein [Desulfobacteraceae bacterium]